MKTLFLVAVLIISSAAIAQQDERKGFYLSAAAGSSKSVDGCDKKYPPGQSSSCSDSSTSWSVFPAYQFNRNLAFEGGYTHLGKIEFAGGEIKTNGWELSFLGGLPTSENFTFFARLGYFSGKSETTGSAASASTSNKGPLAGITLQYELGRNVALRAEYLKYFGGGAISADNSDWNVGRLGALWRFR